MNLNSLEFQTEINETNIGIECNKPFSFFQMDI